MLRVPAPSDPTGDLPREGGDVCSLFASNIARMLRTPLFDRSDMTVDGEIQLAIVIVHSNNADASKGCHA